MIPLISCKVEALCEINPSEDPQKVEQAITNIIDNVEIKTTNYSLSATSKEIESLAKIHESIIHHNTQKIYYRILNQKLEGNSTWFYLHKQAAFVNNIAICEHDDESPLGPIKIVLQSKNIEAVIDCLISF